MHQPVRHLATQLRLLWGDTEIDVGTAARLLNTSDDMVWQMIEEGLLRAYQLRGKHSRWRVSRESVMEHLEKIRQVHAIGVKVVDSTQRREK